MSFRSAVLISAGILVPFCVLTALLSPFAAMTLFMAIFADADGTSGLGIREWLHLGFNFWFTATEVIGIPIVFWLTKHDYAINRWCNEYRWKPFVLFAMLNYVISGSAFLIILANDARTQESLGIFLYLLLLAKLFCILGCGSISRRIIGELPGKETTTGC